MAAADQSSQGGILLEEDFERDMTWINSIYTPPKKSVFATICSV
jgi:hypothetical protein